MLDSSGVSFRQKYNRIAWGGVRKRIFLGSSYSAVIDIYKVKILKEKINWQNVYAV